MADLAGTCRAQRLKYSEKFWVLEGNLGQQYPPGTQENYNSFSSRNHIKEKGKEPEFPEGAGGGKGYRGHEVASTLRREAPLREPGVPPSFVALYYKSVNQSSYGRVV